MSLAALREEGVDVTGDEEPNLTAMFLRSISATGWAIGIPPANLGPRWVPP